MPSWRFNSSGIGRTATVTRAVQQRRPSSSVMSTSQTQLVRPRWRRRPSACTVPEKTGRRNVRLFDIPIAANPSGPTTRIVASDWERGGPVHVRCTCGNEFTTRSTTPEISVEICSNCHPFYTGRQKLVDTGGRVERFNRRFRGGKSAAR